MEMLGRQALLTVLLLALVGLISAKDIDLSMWDGAVDVGMTFDDEKDTVRSLALKYCEYRGVDCSVRNLRVKGFIGHYDLGKTLKQAGIKDRSRVHVKYN